MFEHNPRIVVGHHPRIVLCLSGGLMGHNGTFAAKEGPMVACVGYVRTAMFRLWAALAVLSFVGKRSADVLSREEGHEKDTAAWNAENIPEEGWSTNITNAKWVLDISEAFKIDTNSIK